jgi:hypothetical protein
MRSVPGKLEILLNIVLIAIAVIVIALNVMVSGSLAKNTSYEPFQKNAQHALVWLLPVIGALVVHFFLRESRTSLNKADSHFVESGLGDGYRNESAADAFSGSDTGGDGGH